MNSDIPTSIYDINVLDDQEQSFSLNHYKGKWLLIVNVASQCGFTSQYKGLQKLYEQFQPKNFEILGFPCNQFLKQEPDSNDKIQLFCQLNYGVTFKVFAKINVNGAKTHPLYQFLKCHCQGFLGTSFIKWNFTKFLVDTSGNVIKRFSPFTKPETIAKFIENNLKS